MRGCLPAIGSWQPTTPRDAAKVLAALDTLWWVAGGWALELFCEYSYRSHKDLDIGILRRHAPIVLAALDAWEFFEAKNGMLFRLVAGDVPSAAANSLWGRPNGETKWTLELLLDESDGDHWVFRRNSAITMPLARAIRHNSEGIPYLAPEIQLLYKARALRPEDQADFNCCAPLLDDQALQWLQEAIGTTDSNHPWLLALASWRV
jgi:hypothetical protein